MVPACNTEMIMFVKYIVTDSASLRLIGPILWGHSSPLCHALSLASSWTSMRRRRATVLACDSSNTWWMGVRWLAVVNGPNIFQMLLVMSSECQPSHKWCVVVERMTLLFVRRPTCRLLHQWMALIKPVMWATLPAEASKRHLHHRRQQTLALVRERGEGRAF